MRKTTQKRTKRRRTTMKRIKKNKVMYGGAPEYIWTMSQLQQVETAHKRDEYRFQLLVMQPIRRTIVDTRSIDKLRYYINEYKVFTPNGNIKPEFELVYM